MIHNCICERSTSCIFVAVDSVRNRSFRCIILHTGVLLLFVNGVYGDLLHMLFVAISIVCVCVCLMWRSNKMVLFLYIFFVGCKFCFFSVA